MTRFHGAGRREIGDAGSDGTGRGPSISYMEGPCRIGHPGAGETVLVRSSARARSAGEHALTHQLTRPWSPANRLGDVLIQARPYWSPARGAIGEIVMSTALR
jgi:hypothetical protein